MSARLAAIAVTILLVTSSAQSNTLQLSDAQKMHALRVKLQTASTDVTQAMDHASDLQHFAEHDCLALLHDQAHEVAMVAAGVGDLMALSIMMKDGEDEVRTLSADCYNGRPTFDARARGPAESQARRSPPVDVVKAGPNWAISPQRKRPQR
jgi:hypothetical protein